MQRKPVSIHEKCSDPLLTRRSSRRYLARKISHDTIEYLLRSAMHAPSAGGQRPWSFVVIDKPSLLRKIPSIYPFSDVFETAPLGILVCGDDRLIRHRDYWVQDCAAATENILIAAEAKGLGAVWIGGYPRIWRIIGIAELLKIPDHIMPFALVAIGFPAERKHTADRYDPGRVSVNTAREPGLVRGPRRKRSKSFR